VHNNNGDNAINNYGSQRNSSINS